MGRCKTAGQCVVCKEICLTYDDYCYFDFLETGDLVCFGLDLDRTGGRYYPTACYQKYIQQCLQQRKMDYLNLEYSTVE